MSCDTKFHSVLASVSKCYPQPWGRLSTCYSPVRHSLERCKHLSLCVRLACIRHAASVHPEPGSNSQFENLKIALRLNWRLFRYILYNANPFIVCYELTSQICFCYLSNSHRFVCSKFCSVFNVLLIAPWDNYIILSPCSCLVNYFLRWLAHASGSPWLAFASVRTYINIPTLSRLVNSFFPFFYLHFTPFALSLSRPLFSLDSFAFYLPSSPFSFPPFASFAPPFTLS